MAISVCTEEGVRIWALRHSKSSIILESAHTSKELANLIFDEPGVCACGIYKLNMLGDSRYPLQKILIRGSARGDSVPKPPHCSAQFATHGLLPRRAPTSETMPSKSPHIADLVSPFAQDIGSYQSEMVYS